MEVNNRSWSALFTPILNRWEGETKIAFTTEVRALLLSDDLPGDISALKRALEALDRALKKSHANAWKRLVRLLGRVMLDVQAQLAEIELEAISRRPFHQGGMPSPWITNTRRIVKCGIPAVVAALHTDDGRVAVTWRAIRANIDTSLVALSGSSLKRLDDILRAISKLCERLSEAKVANFRPPDHRDMGLEIGDDQVHEVRCHLPQEAFA